MAQRSKMGRTHETTLRKLTDEGQVERTVCSTYDRKADRTKSNQHKIEGDTKLENRHHPMSRLNQDSGQLGGRIIPTCYPLR